MFPVSKNYEHQRVEVIIEPAVLAVVHEFQLLTPVNQDAGADKLFVQILIRKGRSAYLPLVGD